MKDEKQQPTAISQYQSLGGCYVVTWKYWFMGKEMYFQTIEFKRIHQDQNLLK